MKHNWVPGTGHEASGLEPVDELRIELLHYTTETAKKSFSLDAERLAYAFTVQCPSCKKYASHPLGTLDPKQGACPHVFKFDRCNDALVCECGLKIPGEALDAMGFRQQGRYDRHGNALADRCQHLADEVVALEAENGRLRRKLERKR